MRVERLECVRDGPSLTYKAMEESDVRARLSLAAGKSEVALYFAIGETF